MVFVGGAFGTWVDFLGVHLARGLISWVHLALGLIFVWGAFGTWVGFVNGVLCALGIYLVGCFLLRGKDAQGTLGSFLLKGKDAQGTLGSFLLKGCSRHLGVLMHLVVCGRF